MLKIYNTMSRRQEDFKPRQNGIVKIFTCGPSIYQKAHLGNYRTFLYEDLLVRYLLFKGYGVERAMNLTDIEDKTISEAKRRNIEMSRLTGDVLALFRESLSGFDFVMPEHLIRATESIEQSVKIIQTLEKKGYAYRYKGDYFFDPLKFKGFGKLFGLDMSKWPDKKRRFKKDTYNGNRWNRGDFILWHSNETGDHPRWETAIGRGRPSWNIQDPAIITMSLGDQVDINCGGIDNIYRHHDYNIAIMEAYTGKNYSNYYMHGEHLLVNGQSMSKSRGNIIYPEQLVKDGADWRDIRFFLTAVRHYRERLNYSEKIFQKEVCRIQSFREALRNLEGTAKGASPAEAVSLAESIVPCFERELDDDLALCRAFDAVFDILKRIVEISRSVPLSESLIKKINIEVEKIDNVLKVIYPL